MPGGFLGIDPTVSTSEAKGRWGVDDVYEYRLENSWPGFFNLEYLVIAGGGSGGTQAGGGGGAGGYRSSVIGESSGGGASAEQLATIQENSSLTVTVGAGGAAVTAGVSSDGNKGNNSVFASITSEGGGKGLKVNSTGDANGGSGGGGGCDNDTPPININGGSGTVNQGYDGGDGANKTSTDLFFNAGGGGGAGAAGVNAISNNSAGDGGNGVSSSITGSSVTRAGGGGGGGDVTGYGGTGGGGQGANTSNSGIAGTVNTGSGGGGTRSTTVGASGAGGSGIVILRYPQLLSIDAGPGLTYFTNIVGDNKVSQFVGGTDDISFTTTPLDKSIVYTDRYVYEAPPATSTYSSLSFGTEANRNVIAIYIGGRSGAAINSVTIGGQEATLAYGDGTLGFSYIYYATGVDGTSGDVVIDWSTVPGVAGVAVYSLYNLDNVDPVDGGLVRQDSSTTRPTSLTVSGITGGVGGVGLFGTGVNDASFGTNTFSATDSQSTTQIWSEIILGGGVANSWAGGAIYEVTSDNFDVIVTYSEERNAASMATAIWKQFQ